MSHSWKGIYTAVVTPFLAGDEDTIDWGRYEELIESQCAAGVTGLVVCGTTGEWPTLTHAEKHELVKRTVGQVRGRCRVFAGAGTNSTRSTLDDIAEAEQAGVDGVMVVVPYYSRPTQEGLMAHFTAAAQSTKLPVLLYNIPKRTGVSMEPWALTKVMQAHANLFAVKQASESFQDLQQVVRSVGGTRLVFAGDDSMLFAGLAVGASGVVSVVSNACPHAMVRVVALFEQGDLAGARALFMRVLNLCDALSLGVNPAAIKYLLSLRAQISPRVRAPLTALTSAEKAAIDAAHAENRELS